VRAATALIAALGALGALAGCGSGLGEDGGSSAATVSEAPQRVVVQTSSDGFNPAKVYEEAAPGVVTVRSIFDSGAAEGSGFVLDRSGRIATNAHVVTENSLSGEKRSEAKAVYVEFPDRNVVSAKVVGFDPFADIALIEVEPDGLALHPLALGDDPDLDVGQPVAAIGSPFGEQHSLSVGVVSATDRSVDSLTEFQIEGAMQTDAAITPGNS
jgi:S1-C subfamily serine protease